jgi:hypothetical protein
VFDFPLSWKMLNVSIHFPLLRPEGSNPDPAFDHLQHVYTLLVNRQQVDELLIPKIEEYRNKFPCRASAGTRKDNRFVNTAVWKGLDDRMSLPFHSIVSPQVAQNTLPFFIPSLMLATFWCLRPYLMLLYVFVFVFERLCLRLFFCVYVCLSLSTL